MPVDLEMLLSASPPLYAYSAFVDSQYTRFTSDGYNPPRNYDHGYSVREKNCINDHRLSPLNEYSGIDSSFRTKTSYEISSSNENINDTSSADKSYNCIQPENKLRGKKRVSFADDKGLALVEVRSIPGSPHTTPKWAHDILSLITNGMRPKVGYSSEKKWKIAFSNPPYSTPALEEKLQSDLVALERVAVEEDGSVGDVITGTIKVKNTAYEKEIFLRITFDRWASSEDVCAVFSATEDEGCKSAVNDCDTFTFAATIPPSALRYEVVEFCVCYRVNNLEYWDNNGGVNYRLVTTTTGKTCKTSRQVSQILSNNKERISPQYEPIVERYRACPEIDAWETLFNEQPYW